ncbi:MAG: polysaccharide biosynthesis tyrosine autokinase [Deltaproteobacteria bacterium]|nr:polysaccharide biosynthesis tyrosine autokinase [Deltaproteobacteria bacterium]
MEPFESSVAEEPQIDLREYWNIVLKRRWTVLMFFMAAVTTVTIFTLRQQKIYEARASMIIELYAPQVLGNMREVYNLGAGSYWSNKEYYETQYKVITSRTVAQKIVQLLRLEGNKTFLGIDKMPPEEQKRLMDQSFDYVEMVQGALTVEPVKDSRMVYIKAKHRSPKWAQRLANAAVNAYIDYNLQTRRQITLDAAGWLADRAKELKSRADETENRLQAYKTDKKILSVSLEDRQNITSQKLLDMNQALSRIQTERITLQSRRQQVTDIKTRKLPLDSIDEIIDNKLIQQMKESYFRAKENKAELATRYLPEHPKYKALDEKIKEVRRNLEREIDNVLVSMEAEFQAKVASEKQIQRELAKVKAEALGINKKAITYNRLKRIADNAAEMHQLVRKRQQEAALSAHQETNNVYKLDSAIKPSFPVYPRVRLNILLAAVVGLLGGIGLAFFLEYLDNTIKSHEDVTRILQVPFLGIIPSIKLETGEELKEVTTVRDHYLVSHPKSTVAESCRTVRTNILLMSPENPARRMLVTSPNPQEGKSTVCINIGITMAQSGSKVILLDTDMRRPRLHKTFGISSSTGLTTAILGEVDVLDVIHHSEVPNLDVLPCGPIPPNPTELFHTERFRRIVEQLSEAYDRVIFDSPPVLVVADPLILSSMMDGVVLVVKSASTSRDLARRAVMQMRDVKANILGAVINDLDIHHREYGYYYYRQYGYYYGEKERDGADS